MNYKDALNVTISLDNKKLTRAKLVEIANTLQDRCLLSELDKPTLISFNSYIKDVRSRWDIHLTEWRAITKDIMNVGKQARVIYDRAYARAFDWFFPLAFYIHLGILGLMKDSTPSLFINSFMPLTFESTHEYYLKDAKIWYCEEHSGLVISRDYEDRVVIDGVKPETMLKFAQEIVKKDLEKQVAPKKKTTSTK